MAECRSDIRQRKPSRPFLGLTWALVSVFQAAASIHNVQSSSRTSDPFGSAPPRLRRTFSAVLEKLIWASETDYKKLTVGPMTASEGKLAFAIPVPSSGGRVGTEVHMFGADQGTYQLEPFFDERICYIFDQTPSTSKGDSASEYINRLLFEILGGTEEALQNATRGEISSVSGQECRVYRLVSESKTTLSTCIGSDGELLAANSTTQLGGGLDYGIARLFKNYSKAFSPSLMPPAQGCVDLREGTSSVSRLLQVNDDASIAAVELLAGGNWHAGVNGVFKNMSFDNVREQMLGTKIGALELPAAPPLRGGTLEDSLVSEFDAREQWPHCKSIQLIRNQGSCGSCWAFAAAEVFADRVCIGGGDQNFTVSVEYMLGCDKQDFGCNGGQADTAWKFLTSTGVPAEACYPYPYCPNPLIKSCKPDSQTQASAHGPKDVCPVRCTGGSTIHLLRATSAYAVARPGDMDAMQREVIAKGPIHVAFFVFSDFLHYKNGTYFRTSKATLQGGHSVRILGWGVDETVKLYWLVANSWGLDWGMNGFFHIRRGTNECGIETTPAAGQYQKPGQAALMDAVLV